jgi:hypothetical protein
MTVPDLTAVIALASASFGLCFLVWRSLKGLTRLIGLAEIVAEEFDRSRPGESLPERVEFIEQETGRIADALTYIAKRQESDMRQLWRAINERGQ